MSNESIILLVAACSGVFALAAWVGLLAIPAWQSYSGSGSASARCSSRSTSSPRSWASACSSERSSCGSGRAELARAPTIRCMSTPAQGAPGRTDLEALDAITDAVASGAGIPEVVRAASRALEASLVLSDALGTCSPSPPAPAPTSRRSSPSVPGSRRTSCASPTSPSAPCACAPRRRRDPILVRLVTTMLAAEVERLRAPERASERQATDVPARPARARADRRRRAAERARELGVDLRRGSEHARRPGPRARRRRRRPPRRILSLVERGAAAAVSRVDRGADRARTTFPATRCSPRAGGARRRAARAAESVRRELQAGLPGHTFAVGCSRPCADDRRAAPRRERGAARRERRRGRRGARRARVRARPAPTGCCSRR